MKNSQKGNRLVALLLGVLMLCVACTPAMQAHAPEADPPAAETTEKPLEPEAAPKAISGDLDMPAVKVIVDTDMGYMTDDMLALFGLLQADRARQIELLGITTVSGNTLVAPGTYDTLALLDLMGRSDIPVYIGADEPLSGFRDLDELFAKTPTQLYTGAYAWMEHHTTDYLAADKLISMGDFPAPTSRIQPQSAIDFMIEQVHTYPGQVTILAIGPCTNVAQAIQKDAAFAAAAAGIYYMGGWFNDADGEASPAEFNWWYDPEAVSVCLQAPWNSQTIIPNRIGNQCRKGEDVYLRYKAQPETQYIKFLIDALSPIYEDGQEEDYLDCWDPVVVAAFLSPDLIVKAEIRDVTIDTTLDDAYAVSRSWEQGAGPANSAACNLILEVEREGFWDYMAELYGAQ